MQYSYLQFCEDKVEQCGECQGPTAGTGHPESFLVHRAGVAAMLQKKIHRGAFLCVSRMKRDFLLPVIDMNQVTFGSNFLFEFCVG